MVEYITLPKGGIDMGEINWLCVHCGTPDPDHGDVCGNCDLNPFKLEPGELLDVNPRDFWKFIKTGRLEPIEKRQ